MPDRPAIPAPTATIQGLLASVEPMKEAIEGLNGQRGTIDDAAVSWGDLVRLGLIQPDQVPTDVGSGR